MHIVICEFYHLPGASEETCVRQVGLLSTAGVYTCEESSFVREDQEERTSGVSAVAPAASPSSYCSVGITAESI